MKNGNKNPSLRTEEGFGIQIFVRPAGSRPFTQNQVLPAAGYEDSLEFCRQVAVDLKANANLDQGRGGPGHGISSFQTVATHKEDIARPCG
jgi:hypothetical protein